ncbi:hypothetical protein [Alloactinosynnema sp. L-07]|nr:hypothetical protein [Alloactinosynnema sp. L-07]
MGSVSIHRFTIYGNGLRRSAVPLLLNVAARPGLISVVATFGVDTRQ